MHALLPIRTRTKLSIHAPSPIQLWSPTDSHHGYFTRTRGLMITPSPTWAPNLRSSQRLNGYGTTSGFAKTSTSVTNQSPRQKNERPGSYPALWVWVRSTSGTGGAIVASASRAVAKPATRLDDRPQRRGRGARDPHQPLQVRQAEREAAAARLGRPRPHVGRPRKGLADQHPGLGPHAGGRQEALPSGRRQRRRLRPQDGAQRRGALERQALGQVGAPGGEP